MKRAIFVVLVIAFFNCALARGDDAIQEFPVDPVALVDQGETIEGLPEFSETWMGFRYRFKNEANRDRFNSIREQYEVQYGGACARMGPLSGTGRADLYAVHGNRIYLFASEQCRTTFLRGPDKLLEIDDPIVEPIDADAIFRGRKILDRMLDSMGGKDRLQQLNSYIEKTRIEQDSPDGPVVRTSSLTIAFPDQWRREQTWNEYFWADVLNGDDAFKSSLNGVTTLQHQQVAAFRRQLARHPIVIAMSTDDPQFYLAGWGNGDEQGRPVDVVVVSFHGATTKLVIDKSNGDLLKTEYRGRGPGADLGEIETYYGEFERVNGVRIPTASRRFFDGAPWDTTTQFLEEISIDEELDEALFTRP